MSTGEQNNVEPTWRRLQSVVGRLSESILYRYFDHLLLAMHKSGQPNGIIVVSFSIGITN